MKRKTTLLIVLYVQSSKEINILSQKKRSLVQLYNFKKGDMHC